MRFPKHMSRHALRISLCPFLSALVLIGTLLPPGVRHAHGEMDRPFVHHDHDEPRQPAVSHGHHHDGDEHHSHGHAATPPEPDASIPDECWHLHLALVLIDLTLPAPSEPADGEGDPSDEDTSIVRCGRGFLPGVQGRAESDGRSSSTDGLALPTSDAVVLQAVVSSPPPVTTAPLCDGARRERSGVLLA